MRYKKQFSKRSSLTLLLCAVFISILSCIPTRAVASELPKSPVFRAIQLDKNEIQAGEQIAVAVSVERLGAVVSGDAFVAGTATWISPSGRLKYVNLELDEPSGNLVGKIETNKYAEPGLWRCESVQIFDNSGVGSSKPGDDLTRGDFKVTGSTPDINPPKFLSIGVSPRTVKLGEKLKVTIKASDDVSGLESAFVNWGLMGAPVFENGLFMELSLNAKSGVLEGEMIIPDEAIPGRFTVNNISIKDRAENEFGYPSDPEASFGTAPGAEVDPFNADRLVDLSSAAFTVDIKASKVNVVPPVIISPTSGVLDELKIVDENPDKPGMQISIKGLAVPGYRITVISGGQTLGKAMAGFDGIWRVTANISSPPQGIYAVAELPNGLKSQPANGITRAQAAKLLVKTHAISTELNTNAKGYFKDVDGDNPYALYIESAKDLGMFKDIYQGNAKSSFNPSSVISRGEFAKWLSNIYNATKVYGSQDENIPGLFGSVAELISGNPNATFKPAEDLTGSVFISGFAGEPLDAKSDGALGHSWYEGYIYDLFRDDLIPSYKDWLKRANQTIGRDEFLQLIYKVKGTGASQALSQAQEDSSTAPATGDGLKRVEAVRLVVIAGGYKLDTSSTKFADIFGLKDAAYILTAKKYGLVTGYADATFCPDNQLTRAEAAKLIWGLAKNPLY